MPAEGRPLPQSFYGRNATSVAPDLLGKRLVSEVCGERVAGIIVEVEAYCASDEPDKACHGTLNRGRPTARTRVMFGPPGFAYVYFIYGNHWMFNVVTGEEGTANAVLVRALEPVEGESVMKARRNSRPKSEWTNGPAKLAQAMGIDGAANGCCLFGTPKSVWIESGRQPPARIIQCGPRVGLGRTPEPWHSIPWRFWVADNPWVSKYR